VALLPDTERAFIAPEKLRDYLLSPTHAVGRFKAAFFAKPGYSQDDWQRLADDLRTQHLVREAVLVDRTPHGTKYRISAALVGPAGRAAMVVSIWIVSVDRAAARLITLLPGDP
jgi:hypothetical protein